MVKEKKQQLIIRICCVIAAFVLWLYTSNEDINKVHRINNIPIQIVNEDSLRDSGLVISPHQKFSTSLKIAGKSADVYATKAEQFKLIADLSIYAWRKGENKIPINIVKRPSSNISIINEGTMWISIKADNFIEKTFDVQLKIKGENKKGYLNEQPILKPVKIVVSGAEEYVSSVKRVVAEVNLNNKNNNVTSKVKCLDKNNAEVKEVKLSTNTVNIKIPMKKVKEVGINIKTIGKLQKDFILKNIELSKDKFLITGDIDVLNKIDKLDIEPINLNELKESVVSIPLKIIVPPNVKIVNSKDYIYGKVFLEKVIQKNVNYNIDIKNLGKNLKVKLDKNNVSVVIMGGSSIIKELHNKNIKCYVDLSNLKKGEYLMPIKIDFIKEINIISQNLKFVRVNIMDGDGSVIKEDNKDEEIKEVINK